MKYQGYAYKYSAYMDRGVTWITWIIQLIYWCLLHMVAGVDFEHPIIHRLVLSMPFENIDNWSVPLVAPFTNMV